MCYGEGVIFLRGKCGRLEMLGEEGKRRKRLEKILWKN